MVSGKNITISLLAVLQHLSMAQDFVNKSEDVNVSLPTDTAQKNDLSFYVIIRVLTQYTPKRNH